MVEHGTAVSLWAIILLLTASIALLVGCGSPSSGTDSKPVASSQGLLASESRPSPAEVVDALQDDISGLSSDSMKIEIFGTVTDAKSGTPIANAKVESGDQTDNLTEGNDPTIVEAFRGLAEYLAQEANSEEERSRASDYLTGKISAKELLSIYTASANADASGEYRYQILTMPGMPMAFARCTAPGYAAVVKSTAGPLESSIKMDFALEQGAVVRGRVTDRETGAGVAGISVYAEDVRGDETNLSMSALTEGLSESGDFELKAVTKEDGTYALEGLRAGNYRVYVLGGESGYLVEYSQEKTLNVDEGATSESTDFTLTKGASLAVAIRDEAGTPIAGVRLSAILAEEELDSRFEDPEMDSDAEVMSDSEGKAVLKSILFDKDVVVTARHDDFATAQSASVRVAKGQEAPAIEIRMKKGVNVSGVARNADGTPAPKASIWLEPKGVSPFQAATRLGSLAFAEEDGRFLLPHIPEGEFVVVAMDMHSYPEPGQPGEVSVTVDGKTDITDLELIRMSSPKEPKSVLPERAMPSGTIRGVVLDASDKPVSNALIRTSSQNPWGNENAESGADGRFALEVKGEGPYEVMAKATEGVGFVNDVQAGADIEVRVAARPSLEGQVLDPDGKPAKDCLVMLLPLLEAEADGSEELGQLGEALAFAGTGDAVAIDARGNFEILNVLPGKYRVRADGDKGIAGRSDVFEVTEAGPPAPLMIRLDRGVTLSGVVVDPKGAPLAGVTVEVLPNLPPVFANMTITGLPEALSLGPAGSDTTDEKGAYSIPYLRADTYAVKAFHPEYDEFQQGDVTLKKDIGLSGFQIQMTTGDT